MPLYLVTGEPTVGMLFPVFPPPQVKRDVKRVQWETTKM